MSIHDYLIFLEGLVTSIYVLLKRLIKGKKGERADRIILSSTYDSLR